VYELDEASARITFGNGINGRVPSQDARIAVSYHVSDGAVGNTARNRKWRVSGFPGVFGVNTDPIGGGAGRLDGISQRREARRRTREDHALVSAADIVDAAKALPLLGVARAWVLPRTRPTGTVTLVAMSERTGGVEDIEFSESPRWLSAIERELSGRMPLGTRIEVVRPHYVVFTLRATVFVEPGRDSGVVKQALEKNLRDKFALVASVSTVKVRAAGVPVAVHEIAAWIRGVDGVSRVASLQVVGVDGKAMSEIKVAPNALPRIDIPGSRIDVGRNVTVESP
jgi:predicted phage baseplate assembly protein